MKIEYNLNKYLNECDLINKYNFKSSYAIPYCKNIVIELKIKTLIKQLLEESQSFLCCYILFFRKPKILCNFNKKKTEKIEEAKLQIFVTIRKKKVIEFLHSLFLRDWRSQSTLNSFRVFPKENQCITAEFLTISSIFFIDTNIKNSNFNKIKFKFLFNFTSLGSIQNVDNFIKNYQLFWEVSKKQ
jgi:hypothetical protein